ncbi:isoleucine--tRNA ligase, cytoplasmic, partial [Tanacetum coccineum]
NAKKRNTNGSTVGKAKNATNAYDDLEKSPGSSLVGKKCFRVVADDYVNAKSGTGIVHLAPQFGEDDIINEGEDLVMSVEEDGCFMERITRFSGRYIKEAERILFKQ